MKLTSKQLRQIIKEEVANAVPPRRPSKIMLDLMPKTSKIFDAWCDIYDDGDPSMEEVG
jgi:hypothetical protein